MLRVILQWTTTAREQLRELPPKVRRGFLGKAGALAACDPRTVHKPLTGPLSGCRRITYGRYRLIYKVLEDVLADGSRLLHVRVVFIAAGIRKERDKKDVYDIAKRLIKFGLDEIDDVEIQDLPED